jgi:hypothetical protein
MLWGVRAGSAEDLCPGGHALPEFFRKSSERHVINTKNS